MFGAVALEGLRLIDYHNFTLKGEVVSIRDWNRRLLIPLYYPSPQAVARIVVCPSNLPIFKF